MKWATRPGVHVDRAACAWLIRRFRDPDAEFLFLEDLDTVADLGDDVATFDMLGANLGHHHGDCSFETAIRAFDLEDNPALHELARLIHEADLADDRYEAPEAAGLDAIIRAVSLHTETDDATLAWTQILFDALYDYLHQRLTIGRPPA